MIEQQHIDIKSIAGKHLGRTSDGGFTAPYVTPDKHDKSLLVPIPRELGRGKSNIDSNGFLGYEVWHAYEMSFLKLNKQPVTGVLKICFPCSSYAMIESKSLKLYLNSFDLECFNSVEEVESIIKADLSAASQSEVEVKLHLAEDKISLEETFNIMFDNVDKRNIQIETFIEDEKLLDVSDLKLIRFHTTNLRSLCEITRQKDTANCYIYMKGDRLPSYEGLFKYIISMRDTQHFHENATEIIFNSLVKKYEGAEILVANIFNRRGGLDIHCVRSTSKETLDYVINNYNDVTKLFIRTLQQ